MQTFTDVKENNSDDTALRKNIDDDFRLYILENGLNQKTNIIFTNSKRTSGYGINRYLKEEHFYRVLTNGETIKRSWMLYSETTGMHIVLFVSYLLIVKHILPVDLLTGSIFIGCMNMKTASHTGNLVHLLLLSRLKMHK